MPDQVGNLTQDELDAAFEERMKKRREKEDAERAEREYQEEVARREWELSKQEVINRRKQLWRK